MQYCSAKQLKKLRNVASAFVRRLRQRRCGRPNSPSKSLRGTTLAENCLYYFTSLERRKGGWSEPTLRSPLRTPPESAIPRAKHFPGNRPGGFTR